MLFRSHELAAKRGEIIDIGDARRTFVLAAVTLKAKLLQIPGRVAPVLVGKSVSEIDVELRKEICAALREIETHKWNQEVKA